MRMTLTLIATVLVVVTARADEPMWFVSVYGENLQLVSAASEDANVEDGVFLGTDFVGTVIYVRAKEGYELDGFRPYDSSSSAAAVSSVSESMDAAAAPSASEAPSMDEFGPLTDTGLQYYQNDNYFGWSCDAMYVQPMGNRVYRLRCNDEMEHTG